MIKIEEYPCSLIYISSKNILVTTEFEGRINLYPALDCQELFHYENSNAQELGLSSTEFLPGGDYLFACCNEGDFEVYLIN